jgi:hypothetical protein
MSSAESFNLDFASQIKQSHNIHNKDIFAQLHISLFVQNLILLLAEKELHYTMMKEN